jgi:hypothetical protein
LKRDPGKACPGPERVETGFRMLDQKDKTGVLEPFPLLIPSKANSEILV